MICIGANIDALTLTISIAPRALISMLVHGASAFDTNAAELQGTASTTFQPSK